MTKPTVTPLTAEEIAERGRRKRALHSLLRYHEPGKTPYRRITPAMEADLLRWAATLPDEEILDMRNVGHVLLRWIREHQPAPEDGETPVRMIPEATVGSTFAEVIKRTGWRVDVFWNSAGGWFTARLYSSRDRDGYLVPFDDPIGRSGATPEEACANLIEAVLEWA